MDGYECITNIKGDPKLKIIPTVILTTSSSLSDMEKMEKIGADLFLTKPHSFRELLNITKQIVAFVR